MSQETRNARGQLPRTSVLSGAGFAYPTDVVDNETFFGRCEFDITNDRTALIRETRMRTRRWCGPGENTWTLARDAVRMAVVDSDVSPDEIDVVLVSSCSTIPGYNYPNDDNPVVADLAPLVLSELGQQDAVGVDIKGTYCAGFVRGLQMLDGLLQNPNYRAGLLVCSDVGGRFATAPSNRSSFCFVVGDAAGAVILKPSVEPEAAGVVDYTGTLLPRLSHLTSWGADGRSMLVRGERVGEATHWLLVRDARRLLERNGLTAGDIDWLLPMQTHRGAVDALMKALDWPEEKLLWFGDETGYSASASIPAALAWKRHTGLVRPGDLILVLAVGAGMNSSGALLHA